MLTAIIVAAGSSRRMGFDKLLAPLAGKSVLEHSVDAFQNTKSVAEILVISREDRIEEFRKLLQGRSKVRAIIPGGEHRQDSVNAGLQQLSAETKFVAVHDAARPLVTPEQIGRTYAKARECGGATLAEAISDTLKRGKDGFAAESVDRRELFAMQTPQIFARELLLKAYQMVFASKLHITDEVSAIQYVGGEVALVLADDFNFKITVERDLQLAEMILRERAKSA